MKHLAAGLKNGSIYVLKDGGADVSENTNDVFGAGRQKARDFAGEIVVLKGIFPDGKERFQATIAIPQGEGAQAYKEKLAEKFGTAVGNVTANHFMRGNEGHHYVSLTADI